MKDLRLRQNTQFMRLMKKRPFLWKKRNNVKTIQANSGRKAQASTTGYIPVGVSGECR